MGTPLASPVEALSGPIPCLVENDSQNVKGQKSLSLAGGWPRPGVGLGGQSSSMQKAGSVRGEVGSQRCGGGGHVQEVRRTSSKSAPLTPFAVHFDKA